MSRAPVLRDPTVIGMGLAVALLVVGLVVHVVAPYRQRPANSGTLRPADELVLTEPNAAADPSGPTGPVAATLDRVDSATQLPDTLLPEELIKRETIQRLVDYAATFGPDDPFALDRDRIRELERQENLRIW